jgi:hypothetical protein
MGSLVSKHDPPLDNLDKCSIIVPDEQMCGETSGGSMEIWVQGALFDTAELAAPASGRRSVTVTRAREQPMYYLNGPPSRGVNRARVTRDPAVAVSYSQAHETASDFRIGLARALAQLSPEQRAALRAKLERPEPAASPRPSRHRAA